MDLTFLLERGRLARALAGRDKGEVFVITEILSKDYVLIADGKRRSLRNPKKKKIKHLSLYKDKIILDGDNLTDSYIRKMLKPYGN